MKSAFELELKALYMKNWCKDFENGTRKFLQIPEIILIEKKSKIESGNLSNNSKWIEIIFEDIR